MILDVPKLMRDMDSLLKLPKLHVDPSPLVLTPPPLRGYRKAGIETILLELSTAMDAVAQVRETLVEFQKELHRTWATYQNALAPALTLPVEVLREIFLLAVDSACSSSESVNIMTRNSISSVSTYWRNVSLGFPELWTHIHAPWRLTETLESDLTTDILQRSRNLPLRITTALPYHPYPKPDPLRPISDRLTSISVQWHDWDPLQTNVILPLCQLTRYETIQRTTIPFIIDASKSERYVIEDIEHLASVKHLVLFHAAIYFDRTYIGDANMVYDGPEMSCKTLTVVNSFIESAMLTLATIPARDCVNLILSRILWDESCEEVNYITRFEDITGFAKWLRYDKLHTFTLEYSNHLLELICHFWKLLKCKSLIIRLESSRDSYRLQDYRKCLYKLVRLHSLLNMPHLRHLT